jgi:hypothetical protein
MGMQTVEKLLTHTLSPPTYSVTQSRSQKLSAVLAFTHVLGIKTSFYKNISKGLR